MGSLSSPKVLIVGGGPSGLILALSLLQNGVPVRIIEKTAEPRLGQRGAGIMPRSLELFSHLRIIEPVMKRAILTPTVRMYKMPEGREVLQEFEMSPHRNPTPTHPFLNPVMLGQDSLEKIFHAALAEYGCSVELGTEMASFEQEEDCVRVNLIKRGFSQDMSSGVHEQAVYEWMVGADGARGVVRKQLGLSFLGETRSVENFIVGDIFVEGLSQKYWHIWGDSTDVMISLRATETPTLFNFLVGGKNVNHPALTASEDALKGCFVKHTGSRSDIKFGEIPWMSHYTPNIRMVQSFGYGRVYVAGDAGHVHSPTGGQGMNTGVQDSFNLGWKLALVAKGLARPSLLQSYTEERIPVIKEMIHQTTKLLKRTLDNDETAWKTSGSLFQLGVNYRWSSILVDERKAIEAEREAEEDAYMQDFEFDDDYEDEVKMDSYGIDSDGRLRAGDRAPDSSGLIVRSPSPLAKHACQLFQLFSNAHHTLLVFSDTVSCTNVLQAAALYPKGLLRTVVVARSKKSIPTISDPVDFILEDRDGHTYNSYCPTGVCGICVVRPDGVVGAIVKGSWHDASLSSHLAVPSNSVRSDNHLRVPVVMDSASVFSDDDYDVISNPSHHSLENSVGDLLQGSFSVVRELPASEDAQDRFETTRWTASEIQAYIRKELHLPPQTSFENKRLRVYVDGSFDLFGVGHALQLRQAKLAFPCVHLIVGVFSDDTLRQYNATTTWPEVERLEIVRHCRWVDEVNKDAPWELTPKFLEGKGIDFVAIDEGTSVDPSCDKIRVRGYDELKKHGKIIKTRRTLGLASQQKLAIPSHSQRATPTLTAAPEAPDFTEHVEMYGIAA
ncbi:hypothetical protein NLJ89_g2043 [Agrocybe chaxingu]|uniref:Uncharacterized protein n=1 Tax=Agrocybe chaxingu TaxID=84603 RepID=A0A9W8K870_9AGAR|nr:hypothetical protein NLJ89_g2043 [Agrocybe chaxingu]